MLVFVCVRRPFYHEAASRDGFGKVFPGICFLEKDASRARSQQGSLTFLPLWFLGRSELNQQGELEHRVPLGAEYLRRLCAAACREMGDDLQVSFLFKPVLFCKER